VRPGLAVALVLLLLGPYAAHFWHSPRGVAGTLLGLVPGLLAVALLLAAGFGRADLYLRIGRLSARGLAALVGVSPLLAVILASGTWQGWDAAYAVESALGGVAQELYFRAALLPALRWCFLGRFAPALAAHALLHVLWHGRMFVQAPPAAWPLFFVVQFLAMLGWGYAAHRDRTLLWVVLQHSAFLIAMSPFVWT
jgi:hypothetical protein